MKISIITISYNSGDTIESTIKSVKSQKYSDIEYIVVDGGSEDTTHSIINKYKKLFSHIVIESDEGIYDAMNKGISLSSGEVICILNSDDVFYDCYVLNRVASHFIKNQSLQAVLTDIVFADSNNLKFNPKRVVSSKNFSPWLLRFGWMPPHPGVFLRRSVYEKYGQYKLSYKIAADYEFIVRVFMRGKLKFIVDNFFSVIMRDGGTSTKGLGSIHTISKEIVRSCIENNFYTNYLLVSMRLPIKLIKEVKSSDYLRL